MSEYQYYEFRAIDRPLVRGEMEALRAISTRAEITPSGLTNTYHWGDFKGDPDTLMDRYFDAFVYVANWGSHRLMFRVPRGFLDLDSVSLFCDDEALKLRVRPGHVVVDFSSEDEDGWDEGWIDGEEWMPSLITLRADLIRGDLRALYIGWLATLKAGGWDDEGGRDDLADEMLEPPVPPGLGKLSAPLEALADFLRVEDELIEAAAAASVGVPPAGPSPAEMARWVKGLPLAEKDAYLTRFLVEEGDLALRAELARRFREASAPKPGKRPAPESGRRTVAQLLAARDALVEEKRRKAAERAAKEKARLERDRAAARAKHLDDLARREPLAWREADALIAAKKAKEYDQAVALLEDLCVLAVRDGRADEARARIAELRRLHANKPALMKRFDAHGLGK